MTWAALWDWIQSYLLYLVLGIVVLYFIIRHKVIGWIKRRRNAETKEQEAQTDFSLPFNEAFLGPYDLVSNMKEQKKVAEHELKALNANGKNIVQYEKEIEDYYKQQKTSLYHQKKDLSLRYSTWKNYLNNVSQMIENQRKLDEELKGETFRKLKAIGR